MQAKLRVRAEQNRRVGGTHEITLTSAYAATNRELRAWCQKADSATTSTIEYVISVVFLLYVSGEEDIPVSSITLEDAHA